MTFTAPLGLLALLAVPAVLWLHLFRTRLPERRVAALFLFPAQTLIAGAGRTRTRLLRTPSLWLELLAALALALWLGGLSFGGRATAHVVFVLDDTASMGANGTRERAVAAVQGKLDDLSAADFATVLATGPRPRLLLGPKARVADVATALAAWQPQATRHDPQPALDLARELARGGGEVLFVSDDDLPGSADDIALRAVGVAAPNCALLTVARAAAANGSELRMRIAAFGARASTELTVTAGERELLRLPVVFRDGLADVAVPLPAEVELVRVQLAADALALDDVAWSLPEPVRTVVVCDQLPPERSQALAIAQLLDALPAVRADADSRAAQVLLREQAGMPAPGQIEVVLPVGTGDGKAYQGPFVVDGAHEWLQDVHLQGVVWKAAPSELPGRVLIAAGPRALACEEPRDAGRRLWLACASGGNLMRAPDWPVLWSNVVESARAAVAGPERVAVPLGEEARYRRSLRELEPRDGVLPALTLRAPSGGVTAAGAGPVAAFVLQEPGVHELRGADDAVRARFTARFVDAAESDLRGVRTLARDAVAAPTGDAVARDDGLERSVLALLFLVALLADWWLLARRSL